MVSRIFAVLAEPEPGSQTHELKAIKEGRIEGLGDWRSELRSGWVSHGRCSCPVLFYPQIIESDSPLNRSRSSL